MSDCYMWKYNEDKDKYECCGYNYSKCPKKCKYKKTAEQQLAEEEKILQRYLNNPVYLAHDFVSQVTGDIIMQAGAYNMDDTVE